jgi:predicted DNA-binding transcriptional regulator YafY
MSLLRKGSGTDEAISVLMAQFGVSRRQAYRYIQEAQRRRHAMPVPEEKVVFTVKLPKSLVALIRLFSNSSGDSLSNIVTQALRAFLKRRGHGREAS